MAQAKWSEQLDWGLTGLLCGVSAVIGLTVGLGLAAWNSLATVVPAETLAISVTSPGVDESLKPFFPDIDSVEETLEQFRIRDIVRREAARQQQLDQTREVLAFNGATTEDIEAHFIRQLSSSVGSRDSN